VRCRAAEALGVLQARNALAPLLEKLLDEESVVRFHATRALARIDSQWQHTTEAKEFFDQLLSGFPKLPPSGKRAAAELFGKFKDVRAIRHLLDARWESDREGWRNAEATLASVDASWQFAKGDGSLIADLLRALRSESSSVRVNALRILDRLFPGWETTPAAQADVCERLESFLYRSDQINAEEIEALDKIRPAWRESDTFRSVRDRLLRNLASGDASQRRDSLERLEALGWQPETDRERSIRAIVLEQWDELRALGKAGAEEFLRILTDQAYWRGAGDGPLHDAKYVFARLGTVALDTLLAAIRQESGAPVWILVDCFCLLREGSCFDPAWARLPAMEETVPALIAELPAEENTKLGAWLHIEEKVQRLVAVLVMTEDPRAVRPLFTLARHNCEYSGLAVTALKSLVLKTAPRLDGETLTSLSDFEGVTQYTYDYTPADMYQATAKAPVDTSDVRQLAREELARRGLFSGL
jgi:HEAT repeat protein